MRLNNLVHAYASTPFFCFEFKWHSEQFDSLRSLRNNKPFDITDLIKGSGVIILIIIIT